MGHHLLQVLLVVAEQHNIICVGHDLHSLSPHFHTFDGGVVLDTSEKGIDGKNEKEGRECFSLRNTSSDGEGIAQLSLKAHSAVTFQEGRDKVDKEVSKLPLLQHLEEIVMIHSVKSFLKVKKESMELFVGTLGFLREELESVDVFVDQSTGMAGLVVGD